MSLPARAPHPLRDGLKYQASGIPLSRQAFVARVPFPFGSVLRCMGRHHVPPVESNIHHHPRVDRHILQRHRASLSLWAKLMHLGRRFVAFSRTEPSASIAREGRCAWIPVSADVGTSYRATAVDPDCYASMSVAGLLLRSKTDAIAINAAAVLISDQQDATADR
jgi:hypothetical protein